MSKLIPVRTVRFQEPMDAIGVSVASSVTTGKNHLSLEIHPNMQWVRVTHTPPDGGEKRSSWIPAARIKSLDAPELDKAIEALPARPPKG